MQSFSYYSPTKLHFGAGAVQEHMADEVAARGFKTALVVTGGGSVRRNGSLDAVLAALSAAGVRAVEFSGIEPNPRVTSVDRAAELCRPGRRGSCRCGGRRLDHGCREGDLRRGQV